LVKNYYYFYPGYNLINFYADADAVGQHILLYAIDYSISNAVAINVASLLSTGLSSTRLPATINVLPTIEQPAAYIPAV
jgi:hypothetical protein